MCLLYKSPGILGALLSLSSLACGGGDSNTEPPALPITPVELQLISGDNQGTLRGDAPPDPLRVRAVGSGGQPAPGATVRWAVAQGEASLDPAQSATDASGEAETSVTAGATLGTVLLSATVEAVAPVVFTLTTLDPCQWAKLIGLETPVTGVLRPLDCVDQGLFWDLYSFTLGSQQAVTIRAQSDEFDTRSWLFTVNAGLVLGRAGRIDSTDASSEAVAKAILPSGEYWAGASSFRAGIAGSYVLRVSMASPQAESCEEEVWVVRGITTGQQLASTDCVEFSGRAYQDAFSMILWAGERLAVRQTSAQFDPRLRLLRRSGAVLADVDGGATGTAAIDFTAESERGEYIIVASSVGAQQAGDYTLTVSDPSEGTAGASSRSEDRTLGQFSGTPNLRAGVRR